MLKEARPLLPIGQSCAVNTPTPLRPAILPLTTGPVQRRPGSHSRRTLPARTLDASMEWLCNDSPHGGARSSHARRRLRDASETRGQVARGHSSNAAGNGSRVHEVPAEAPVRASCPFP